MAIFASTTTSGYSDPLKAMSIKALEQRYKEMSAQQAAAQQGMFTPENTQTPVQGLAQVANVAVDAMRSRRADEATAAGRNEFAQIIAQGAQGPDGAYSPQQLAVMARRDPDFMSKLVQQQHDLKYQGKQLTSEEARATQRANTDLETNRLTNTTSAANVAAQQAGESARTVLRTGSDQEIARGAQEGQNTRQGSSQTHEANQLRLKAELEDAQKQKEYAQQDKNFGAVSAQQERIAKLQAELALTAQTQGEAFKASQQKEQLSQDVEMKKMDREAVAANLKLQLANQTQNAQMKIEAEKELNDITNRQNLRRDELKAAQALTAQTQAEKATSGDVAARTTSAENIAKAEAAAKADALAKDPKRAEAVRAAETDYRKGLTHLDNLEEATRILEHPKGIYTGAAQNAAPIAGGIPGIGGMLVDKEKAQRTARFNTIVGEDAIRDMATTLKGSSTNYEMGEFKKMKNDPNISDADRANQLKKVVKAARADLAAQAKEVQTIGGDIGRVDRSMKGGEPVADVPRPAGKNDSELIAEAEAAKKAGKPAAAVDAQLQKWLMSK